MLMAHTLQGGCAFAKIACLLSRLRKSVHYLPKPVGLPKAFPGVKLTPIKSGNLQHNNRQQSVSRHLHGSEINHTWSSLAVYKFLTLVLTVYLHNRM